MKIGTERIQYSEDFLSEENIDKNISILWGRALPILDHRKRLYKRFTRAGRSTEEVMVALEFYISIIATGYFAGKEPQYKVKKINDTQKSILQKIFNKIFGEKNNANEFQAIIDYITKYNDNGSFFYNLVKDYIVTGGCYGLLYENKDSEVVYAETTSLNTIAIWNFDTPCRKIGLLRCWYETTAKKEIQTHLEIITENYKRHYIDGKPKQKISADLEYDFKNQDKDREEKNWKDLPVIAVENPDGLALFEAVISLINKHEKVIKNNAEIFDYNNAAKLKIVGYQPENDLLVPASNDEENTEEDKPAGMVLNPLRLQEDNAILNSQVFYTDKDGDIDWILKDINDTASENHKKTLLDLILMISCVPNVTDQGFTNADNSAALEKKFFPLEQVLQQAENLFRKELLRMWEMITARINMKKGKEYDFRDIEIIFTRNIPQNSTEIIERWLKLRGLVSDKTIIDHLPYDLDSESELAEMDLQNEENIQKNIENMKRMGQDVSNAKLNTNQNKENTKYEVKRDNIEQSDTVTRKEDKEKEDE